jgi:lipoate-protein ligase A
MEQKSPPYPAASWRLVLSDPLPGNVNMAVDAAILAGVENGQAPPTLRLYRWDPPCLSLGYSQPFSDLDQAHLTERGWDVVRRPTGGRAILHVDELTYAVIGPKSDPRLEGGLMDSYRRLSEALFRSLDLLGLPVQVHQGKNPLAHQQPVCFENPSEFEITAGGKKIIGSAQARKKAGILQHGSLPLYGDLTRITEVLAYSTPAERERAAQTLLLKAATVESILGRIISWEEASSTFVTGFSEILNLELVVGGLSEWEQQQAEELSQNQFGGMDWTRQVR